MTAWRKIGLGGQIKRGTALRPSNARIAAPALEAVVDPVVRQRRWPREIEIGRDLGRFAWQPAPPFLVQGRRSSARSVVPLRQRKERMPASSPKGRAASPVFSRVVGGAVSALSPTMSSSVSPHNYRAFRPPDGGNRSQRLWHSRKEAPILPASRLHGGSAGPRTCSA